MIVNLVGIIPKIEITTSNRLIIMELMEAVTNFNIRKEDSGFEIA